MDMEGYARGSELVGKRVTLRVHKTPCIIRADGYLPLRESVSGIIKGFSKQPAGPVGILEDDDGNLIAFDAGLDLQNGRIDIEVPMPKTSPSDNKETGK